jgi:hypothetical protein
VCAAGPADGGDDGGGGGGGGDGRGHGVSAALPTDTAAPAGSGSGGDGGGGGSSGLADGASGAPSPSSGPAGGPPPGAGGPPLAVGGPPPAAGGGGETGDDGDHDSSLHATLWKLHAFRFFKMLYLGSDQARYVFTMKLAVPASTRLKLVTTVSSIVGNSQTLPMHSKERLVSPGNAGDNDDFDFEEDESQTPGMSRIGVDFSHYFFFSALSTQRHHVLDGAANITDWDSVVLTSLKASHLDPINLTLRVNLPSQEKDLLHETFVFSPHTFSKLEMGSVFVWSTKPSLYYDVGFSVPVALEGDVQTVIGRLLPTAADPQRADSIVVTTGDDQSGKLAALRFLSERGVAKCTFQDAMQSRWVLTTYGLTAVVSCNDCDQPRNALKERPGIALLERDVFELHSVLTKGGWSHSVVPKDRKLAKLAVAYVVGGAKTWWLQRQQKTFHFWYLAALLTAPQHGQPVKHGASNATYKAMIEGKPAPVKRSRADGFDCETSVHPDTVVKAKRAMSGSGLPRVRKPRPRARVSSASSAASAGHSSDESISAASSSSKSSSSRSSSSSSSDEAPPVEVIASAAAEPPVKAPRRGHAHNTDLKYTTSFWRGFRFTSVDAGIPLAQVGWEVTCKGCGHGLCRKNMKFAPHGGQLGCERKLKAWLLWGGNVSTQGEHVKLPLEDLPSDAELENLPLPTPLLAPGAASSSSGIVVVAPAKKARKG